MHWVRAFHKGVIMLDWNRKEFNYNLNSKIKVGIVILVYTR